MSNRFHSETWCPLPFVSLTIHPTGKLTHCMMSEEKMGDLDSGWDNPNFQEMRRIMLDGDWNLTASKAGGREQTHYVETTGRQLKPGPADCANCYNKEQRGLQSQRINWLDNMIRWFPEGTYDRACKTSGNDIWHLNLNLSNICNFKCRMCSPNYSNSLIPDFKHLQEIGSPVRGFDWTQNKQIIDPDEILERYGPQLSKLNTIWVTGGEPFMDDRLFEFTEKLRAYCDITKIKMFITTNGSKIDFDKFDVFDDLELVNINLSVDATGDLFTYMRSAGVFDWNQLEEVMVKMKNWQQHEKHKYQRQLSYNASFQTYNSYNTGDFFRYFIPKLRKNDWIEYRMLVTPTHLGVQHMQQYMKDHIHKDLQDVIDNVCKLDRERKTIRNLQQALTNKGDPVAWDNFIKYTVDLDHYRGQYLYDYAPDLYQAFDTLTLEKFDKFYAEKNNKDNWTNR